MPTLLLIGLYVFVIAGLAVGLPLFMRYVIPEQFSAACDQSDHSAEKTGQQSAECAGEPIEGEDIVFIIRSTRWMTVSVVLMLLFPWISAAGSHTPGRRSAWLVLVFIGAVAVAIVSLRRMQITATKNDQQSAIHQADDVSNR